MKKIMLSLWAVCVLCCVMLTSCSTVNQEASSQATQAFTDSYDTALTLYRAVYGDGFAPAEGYALDPNGDAYSQYAPVGADCPYQNTAEMKTAIEKYFSEDLAETVCRVAFGKIYADGSSDGNGLSEDSESIAARYRDNGGKLEVNLAHTTRLAAEEPLQPDFSTLSPTSVHAANVVLGIKMCPADPSDGRSLWVEFTLLRQSGGWKFDTPPYVNKTALELQ